MVVLLERRVGHHSPVHVVEDATDVAQRPEQLLLGVQHEAQALDIAVGVLAVARRGAFGLEQTLVLEIADLALRQRRELRAELLDDLADAEPEL